MPEVLEVDQALDVHLSPRKGERDIAQDRRAPVVEPQLGERARASVGSDPLAVLQDQVVEREPVADVQSTRRVIHVVLHVRLRRELDRGRPRDRVLRLRGVDDRAADEP